MKQTYFIAYKIGNGDELLNEGYTHTTTDAEPEEFAKLLQDEIREQIFKKALEEVLIKHTLGHVTNYFKQRFEGAQVILTCVSKL